MPLAFPKCPLLQSEQTLCPAMDIFPGEHATQADAPGEENVPTEQFKHAVIFPEEYVPAAHWLHPVDADFIEERPAGHKPHFSIPVAEKYPGLQNAAQVLKLVDPVPFVLKG